MTQFEQQGMRSHRQVRQTQNMLLGEQEVHLSDREQELSMPAQLEPGQFSVHHSRLLHGSYGASLLRGVDECGQFLGAVG